MEAASRRATNVVKLLKQHGADVNKLDDDGRCALTRALKTKDQCMIEELLPTVIPAGLDIQKIWHDIARFQPKMSNPFKKFIQQAVNSGWCLKTCRIFTKNQQLSFYLQIKSINCLISSKILFTFGFTR